MSRAENTTHRVDGVHCVALISAAIAAGAGLAYGIVEHTLITPANAGFMDIAGPVFLASWLGWAFPAWLFVVVLVHAGERLPREFGLLLLALHLVGAVALDASLWPFAAGVAALGVFVYRTKPDERLTAPSTHVALGSLALAVGFVGMARYHWGSDDNTARVIGMSAGALLFLSVGIAVGAVALDMLSRSRRLQQAVIALGVAGAIIGGAFLGWFYFGLYTIPKLFVVWLTVLTVAVLLMQNPPDAGLNWRRSSVGFLVVTCAAIGLQQLQPVSARLDGAPLGSMVGVVRTALSVRADRDLDGFYDVEAGGNDCEPDRRSSIFDAARCMGASPAPPLENSGPTFDEPVEHVFVVLVDALRPDEIGAGTTEASGRPQTPGFDRFRARATTFRQAYGPSNATYMAIRPMLAGISPPAFTLVDPRRSQSDAHTALASRHGLFSFDEPGTAEEVMLQCPIFPDRPAYLGQQIDTREITGVTSKSVIDATETWLGEWSTKADRKPIRMLLYSHDPHAHYECADGSIGGRRCYREEVLNVDRAMSRLIDLLDEHNMWERSLVVLLADHGEAFGEHTHEFHASSLYEEQVRIPLMVAHPSLTPGATVDAPVSAMSLVATAADALHHAPSSPFASLLGIATGRQQARPPIIYDLQTYDWWIPRRRTALVQGDMKLIYNWNTRTAELYDLAADPYEQQSLHQRTREVEALTDTLLSELLAREPD